MSCSLRSSAILWCTKTGHEPPVPTSSRPELLNRPIQPLPNFRDVDLSHRHPCSSFRLVSDVLRYYMKHHIGLTELADSCPLPGSTKGFIKWVSIILTLSKVMLEEAKALRILKSGWTALGCWQYHPLHQNSQRGVDNCKSQDDTGHKGCASTATHLQHDGWSLTMLTPETQVPGFNS